MYGRGNGPNGRKPTFDQAFQNPIQDLQQSPSESSTFHKTDWTTQLDGNAPAPPTATVNLERGLVLPHLADAIHTTSAVGEPCAGFSRMRLVSEAQWNIADAEMRKHGHHGAKGQDMVIIQTKSEAKLHGLFKLFRSDHHESHKTKT